MCLTSGFVDRFVQEVSMSESKVLPKKYPPTPQFGLFYFKPSSLPIIKLNVTHSNWITLTVGYHKKSLYLDPILIFSNCMAIFFCFFIARFMLQILTKGIVENGKAELADLGRVILLKKDQVLYEVQV